MWYRAGMKKSPQTKAAADSCPLSRVTAVLGDHCSLLIIRDLLTGPKRFKDLSDSLPISTRTLTLKLKKLEECELITRKSFLEKPPRVEYALTREGRGLKNVISAMMHYGEKYL